MRTLSAQGAILENFSWRRERLTSASVQFPAGTVVFGSGRGDVGLLPPLAIGFRFARRERQAPSGLPESFDFEDRSRVSGFFREWGRAAARERNRRIRLRGDPESCPFALYRWLRPSPNPAKRHPHCPESALLRRAASAPADCQDCAAVPHQIHDLRVHFSRAQQNFTQFGVQTNAVRRGRQGILEMNHGGWPLVAGGITFREQLFAAR